MNGFQNNNIHDLQSNRQYDIFLAGPWEQYSEVPWKTEIKKAFPCSAIYEPEDHQNGDWFVTNTLALNNSKNMVVYVPEFPFPGVGLEAGMFWANLQLDKSLREEFPTNYRHNIANGQSPHLIYLWRDAVQPDYGKEVAKRTGIVVPTLEETIIALQKVM